MKCTKILSKILLLCVFILSINMMVSVASAQELSAFEVIDESAITEGEKTISPRGEVTGYKYMTVNGVTYRRLWSYTRGCWIDDRWYEC